MIEPILCSVAGIMFEGREKAASECEVGENLMLLWEPTNKYDPNAVMVCRVLDMGDGAIGFGGQIGYVPRALAGVVSQHLRDGVELVTTVTSTIIDPRGQFTPDITIRIEERKVEHGQS